MQQLNQHRTRGEAGEIVLRLTGPLTIWTAPEAREFLTEALAEAGDLTLDVAAIDAVDVAGLQLICATHRATVEEGRTLRVEGLAAVLPVAEAAGFTRHVGCADGCIWRDEARC